MKLNTKTLREQIYDYIREEMQHGNLIPGASVNMNTISQQLGISKTPLRDALIQLEIEGFVTILPRRGVVVNKLTFEEIKHVYEILGALEASVICTVFDRLKSEKYLSRMRRLNAEQRTALLDGDFDAYYVKNLAFHDVFLDLSENALLKKLTMPLKQRLYDFPRRGYMIEWELGNIEEHQQLIERIEQGDCYGASDIWKNVHWSPIVQKENIRRFYNLFKQKLKDEMARH